MLSLTDPSDPSPSSFHPLAQPHENPEVRIAVLFAIGNLTWGDDAQVGNRVQYFRDAGVDTQIQRLLEHEVMGDVRTRSKQVLEQLNAAPAADTGSSIQ